MLRCILLLLLACALLSAADDLDWLDAYDVVWNAPSTDAVGSMPCGGGDTGMNVWVQDGEVLCYVQRSGCFDENNQYLKLGRLRIRLDPDPFAAGGTFRQALRLRHGRVVIEGSYGDADVRIILWAEVRRPVVHVEVEASRPVAVTATYENWRTADVDLPDDAARPRFACLGWDGYPGTVTRFQDVIAFAGDTVAFHHRNRDDRLLFDYTVRQQGLEAVKDRLTDTQRGRTFGGVLRGDGFAAAGTCAGRYLLTPFTGWRLRSQKPAVRHRLELVSHIAQTPTLAAWEQGLAERLAAVTSESVDTARREALAWWADFWRRSRIVIRPGADATDPAWRMARNYQLFRYQLGCNAYGDHPTKFNGGNVTFDPSLVDRKHANDPDWRAWGGGSFTAQNQRLVHWPMLKAGDADLVTPQLEYYRRALPSAVARVQAYYGHEGCLFAEQLENFGLPIAAGWGWPEPGAKKRQRGTEIPFGDPRVDGSHGPNGIVEKGEQANAYVSYHYESQVEMSYLALERHRFAGGDLKPHLPLIRQSLRFFDEHYQLRQRMRSGRPLGDDGKLVLFPSSSCESYRGARDPADLIAGLDACLESLLALGDDLIPAEEKAYYRAFRQRLPAYTWGIEKGDRILQPAASWKRYQNVECPQFYPLFPFNRFALGRDDMAVFRDTWKHGRFPKDMVISWHQDGIFYARMGMTAEAAAYNQRKLDDAKRRFPTFWGPGHDWVPDHNWGGSGMIGLQEMLMQTIGDRILLLPAWPRGWDVDFLLHAPRSTQVRCSVRGDRITVLEVTPAARRADVQVGEGFGAVPP